MPGAPVSLACWVGIPGTLSAYYFENELQTSESNNNFQENWKWLKNFLSKKKKKFKGLQKICFVTKAERWHDLMKRQVACAVSETHVSAMAT